MARQASFNPDAVNPAYQGRADKLEDLFTLAASDVAPDKILSRGRELGVSTQEILTAYRAGRSALVENEKGSAL